MRIIKRARAHTDLVDLWVFSCETWNEAQADAYFDKLETALTILADNPQIGVACDWLRPGMRRLNADRHLIFYRIHDDWIEVVRVLHERMDVAGKFEE